MIGASKSLAKEPLFETKQSKVAIATSKESIFEENNTQGASKPRALTDNKKYRLFCAPTLPQDCLDLCQKYIGQGSTICVYKDCQIVHRGEDIVPEQLFVQKSKGHVFSEPTLDALVNPKFLATWKSAQHTLTK